MCALTHKLPEGVQGWHPYALTSADHRPKIVFGYLGWVCSKCIMPKVIGGFRGGAPYAYTSAHHRPKKKAFLDLPRMGAYKMRNANISSVIISSADGGEIH